MARSKVLPLNRGEGMMSELEKRLANTETALLSLWEIMKDTMPPDYQNNIDKMMNDFFEANSGLGASFFANGEVFEQS